MTTKREPDENNIEVWSTVIATKGEGHRYSSSGGHAERVYYKRFVNPPRYVTLHFRRFRWVEVRVTRQDLIDEIEYNIKQHRKG